MPATIPSAFSRIAPLQLTTVLLLHQRDPRGVDRSHTGSIAVISKLGVPSEGDLAGNDLSAAPVRAAGRVVALEVDFLIGEVDRSRDVNVRGAVDLVHDRRRIGVGTLVEGDPFVG